jgi:hypothetical protein
MKPEGDETVRTPSLETPLSKRILSSTDLLGEVMAVPAGEVTTYGATPLDRMLTLSQQLQAKQDFLKLTYRIPKDVPIEIATHVHDSFGRRFDARGAANDENFVTSIMYERQDELDPTILDMVQRATTGHASPAELLLVRESMGIRSVELACLTHPYGTNIEILEDMRTAVELAILSVGGKLFDTPKVRYAVKESIGDDPDAFDTQLGLLMTRKRIIGVLPDGTEIRERSSFILRTDSKSYLPDEIRDMLDSIAGDDPEWKAKAGTDENLTVYLGQLLSGNHYAFAIPISSTAYAFNEKTAKEVAAHIVAHEAERQLAWDSLTEGVRGWGVRDMNDEEAFAFQAEMEAKHQARREVAYEEMDKGIPIFEKGTQRYFKPTPSDEN